MVFMSSEAQEKKKRKPDVPYSKDKFKKKEETNV